MGVDSQLHTGVELKPNNANTSLGRRLFLTGPCVGRELGTVAVAATAAAWPSHVHPWERRLFVCRDMGRQQLSLQSVLTYELSVSDTCVTNALTH